MHSFFGLIKVSGSNQQADAHATAIKAIARKFPRYYAGAQSFVGDAFQLLGGFRHSAIENHSQLFFCGEIYNQQELAGYLKEEIGQDRPEKLIHELILQEGFGSVSQLNGRFTILYQDDRSGELHLFNDQLGVQQLIYFQHQDFLLFASEIKYLLAHPLCTNEIDWENALKRPIPFIVIDGSRNYNAWFKDIHMLPEASDLSVHTQGSFSVNRTTYWTPYSRGNYDNMATASSAVEVMDAYMQLLDDAVQIRIQDGEAATAFLSGGLDSSIICALANQHRPTNTFSILTQATVLEETSDYCDRLARDLRFSNTQFIMPSHRFAHQPNIWKKRILRDESPYVHKDAITKTLLHHQISKQGEAGYVLTGTGSDQFNGGLARWITDEGNSPEENWDKLMQRIREEELKNAISTRYPTMWGTRELLKMEFINEMTAVPLEENPWMYYVKSNLYINQYSLLWDENRAGYSHNRSVRYPFLDFRFYELIAQIPTGLQAQLFYDKTILRQPASKLLPDYITHKGKAPAFHPLYDHRAAHYQQLTQGGNSSLLEEAFNKLDSRFVDQDCIRATIQRLEHAPDNVEWQYVMHLVNLGLLSTLSEQTESCLDYETELDAEIERITDWNSVSPATLRAQLDIVEPEVLDAMPLGFAPACRLVTDAATQQQFLVRNDELLYEVDSENKDWISFLEAIDNQASLKDILQQRNIAFSSIQEYYELCLQEGILKPIPEGDAH